MAESAASPFTGRHRRPRDPRPGDDAPAFTTDIVAAPAPPPANPPRPYGELAAASAAELLDADRRLRAHMSLASRDKSRRGLLDVLAYLERYPAETWQQRWELAGLNQPSTALGYILFPDNTHRRGCVLMGIQTLFTLRTVQPSLAGFRANIFAQYPRTFRVGQRDRLLDEFLDRIDDHPQLRTPSRTTVWFDVACALTTQGIGFADLTPSALLHYGMECRRLGLGRTRGDTRRVGGLLAWQMLWETGHFPPSTPPTMRAFLYAGQRSVAELVDRYPIRDKVVRQLLVDYITRRRADSDYCHIESMARMLAGHFWSAIEAINPAQPSSLEIGQATYEQWREGLNWLPDGTARKDPHSTVILVRALYTDLHSWAIEDPATWARWAVTCPIPNSELRGHAKRRRRLKERIDDRMRQRQPLLPALVEYVETRYDQARRRLAAAQTVEPGARFLHDGVEFARIDRGVDRSQDRFHLRVRNLASGAAINVSLDEDYAFWRWATVEVLRLSGVRSEELCELSHLSIRQYRRPGGEVIALLVIAPSKSDRERVIPMSAELFHVIAQIVKRHTAGGHAVPLLTRYDIHDRTWSEPLPFLFQRQYGSLRTVASPGTIQGWLTSACRELAETHPGFRDIRFSPHDFRRLFATELANSGLPIHIGAALLGHLNLETFRGYVTVFDEDVVRHYQAHLDKRRRDRSQDEYAAVTPTEWSDFEEHFDKRKVELGGCARPYGTGCQHEHACIRCPMLNINPKVLPRLNEIEDDLLQRRARAEHEGWVGEIEGIELTLSFLRQKREQTERLTRLAPEPTLLALEPTHSTRSVPRQ